MKAVSRKQSADSSHLKPVLERLESRLSLSSISMGWTEPMLSYSSSESPWHVIRRPRMYSEDEQT